MESEYARNRIRGSNPLASAKPVVPKGQLVWGEDSKAGASEGERGGVDWLRSSGEQVTESSRFRQFKLFKPQMFLALIKIIPLDLAATLSPGILALTLVILASKNHARAHILALLSGSLLVGVGIILLGFVLGSSFDTDVNPTLTSAIIDLGLGFFLIAYGLKIFFSKERKISLKEEGGAKILKWFGIGLVITATNFDALFLIFTASKETGDAEIGELAKLILLVVNLFFFTLPITLPWLLKLIFPKVAEPILEKINGFTLKYSRYIVFIMFLVFGVFLLYRGLKYF